jgi:hypothetical protein
MFTKEQLDLLTKEKVSEANSHSHDTNCECCQIEDLFNKSKAQEILVHALVVRYSSYDTLQAHLTDILAEAIILGIDLGYGLRKIEEFDKVGLQGGSIWRRITSPKLIPIPPL